jgi:hypothetical protein
MHAPLIYHWLSFDLQADRTEAFRTRAMSGKGMFPATLNDARGLRDGADFAAPSEYYLV